MSFPRENEFSISYILRKRKSGQDLNPRHKCNPRHVRWIYQKSLTKQKTSKICKKSCSRGKSLVADYKTLALASVIRWDFRHRFIVLRRSLKTLLNVWMSALRYINFIWNRRPKRILPIIWYSFFLFWSFTNCNLKKVKKKSKKLTNRAEKITINVKSKFRFDRIFKTLKATAGKFLYSYNKRFINATNKPTKVKQIIFRPKFFEPEL